MKLLLLDKDGTLVQPKSGQKFVNEPWDQEPLLGVKNALQLAVADSWLPVIVSNQGGVAAGYKSLENTIDEMRFCLGLFPEIKEAFFCPDEGNICWRAWGKGEEHRIEYTSASWDVTDLNIGGLFRKPNRGMLKLASAHDFLFEYLPRQIDFIWQLKKNCPTYEISYKSYVSGAINAFTFLSFSALKGLRFLKSP